MYEIIRDVTIAECNWLNRTFKKGERVHSFEGCTYGCVSHDAEAYSIDGKAPFFELPSDALKQV